MVSLEIRELIEHLRDLKAMRSNAAFQRIMYRNFQSIEWLNDTLVDAEPTDAVAVAKIQTELGVKKRWQKEYEDCEKLLFELENKIKPDISKNNDSGLVPPSNKE